MKMKQIKHSKNGVALSLNMVIIGIILLVVLAVTLWIFYKGANAQDGFLNSQYDQLEDCTPGSDNCELTGGLGGSKEFILPFIPALGLSCHKRKKRVIV
jgi:hypothetical protein